MKLLSIITINYNNKIGLEKTIKSVVNQTYSDFEYIIIDGNSIDTSVDVIRKYSNSIDYWISEPDKGIYNAMNKGISQAQGEYLLFLNSGDIIKDRISLDNCVKLINDDSDIIYFDLNINNNGEQWLKLYPDRVTKEYFLYESLPHPATFFKRTLFTKYGLYDESLKICSDWAFYLKTICKEKSSYKHYNSSFSVFFLDGISSRSEYKKLIEQEKYICFSKIFYPLGSVLLNWFSFKTKLRLLKNKVKRYKFTIL